MSITTSNQKSQPRQEGTQVNKQRNLLEKRVPELRLAINKLRTHQKGKKNNKLKKKKKKEKRTYIRKNRSGAGGLSWRFGLESGD